MGATNETPKASRIERRGREALSELDAVKEALADMVRSHVEDHRACADDVELTVMQASAAFAALARAHEVVECIYDPSPRELATEEAEEAELAVQQ